MATELDVLEEAQMAGAFAAGNNLNFRGMRPHLDTQPVPATSTA